MSDSPLVQLLLFGHIISAIGLLGGSMAFAFAVGPTLPKLRPGSRKDVVTHLFPRFANVMLLFATGVAAFGAALVVALHAQDPGRFTFDPSTAWGLRISVGALIGALVVADGFLVITPTVKKLAKMAEAMPEGATGPPPAAFVRLQGHVVWGSLSSMFLMLAAIGLMVSAASL